MAVSGIVTVNQDGTVRFEAVCMLCDQPVALDRLDAGAFAAWRGGMLVGDAFPELSASEREVLVSGSHAECFEAAFAEEDEGPADDEDDFPEYELP